MILATALFCATLGCDGNVALRDLLPAAPERSAAGPAPDPLEHLALQYFGVYLQDQKAGWAEERVSTLPDGTTRVAVRVQLRVQRMGVEMKTEMVDVTVFEAAPSERLLSFELTQRSGGVESVTSGVAVGETMKVAIRTGSKTTTQEVSRSRMALDDRLAERYARRVLEAQGKPVVTWQLNPQTLSDMKVSWRLEREVRTNLRGVPVSILEIRGQNDELGLTMTNRITKDGVPLEATIGPGLKLVLEDRDVAMDLTAAAPDIYRLSVVPLGRKLGLPSQVSELKLALHGLPPTLDITDARQARDGVVVSVRRIPFEKLPASALTADERSRWLEPTAFLDHRTESLRAFARRVAGGAATDVERVAQLNRAVYRQLSYSLGTAPLTASGILSGGKGDCTEYARVMTAAARSLGLPAREVAGLAYAGDSNPGFTYHAWTEVYVDGKWLAADPTWNQVPIDATHIALRRDDPSAIVSLLGGLRAEVLD